MKDHPAEKISDAELAVVQAVWALGGTATFAAIRARISTDWGSPSTLNTLLKRLVAKGILRQEKRDVYYYTSTISEHEYTSHTAKTFVDKVFGGSVKGLLAALIDADGITPGELDELRDFWQKGRDGDA